MEMERFKYWRLEDMMARRHMTKTELSAAAGMSRGTLLRKMRNGWFTAAEMKAICEKMEVKDPAVAVRLFIFLE